MSPETADRKKAPPKRQLLFTEQHGRQHTIPLTSGLVTPTAGGATFDETPRAERTAITDFTGNELIRLDAPVLLDGFRENRSVERQLSNIIALCRGQDGEPPTPFVATGPMPFSGLRYVMEFPDFGEGYRRASDGDLTRIALTLHLVQFVRPDSIRIRRTSAKTRTLTLPRPMTCVEMGAFYLNDPSRGKEIARLNGVRDPLHPALPAGTKVTIPTLVYGLDRAQEA